MRAKSDGARAGPAAGAGRRSEGSARRMGGRAGGAGWCSLFAVLRARICLRTLLGTSGLH